MAQDIRISCDHKGETVGLRHAAFPDITPPGVTLTLHFLGPQRRMAEIAQKQRERPISSLLKVLGESFVILDKARSGVKSHE
jgi:hypothetical protein